MGAGFLFGVIKYSGISSGDLPLLITLNCIP
jgi:hypothetical protein